MVAMNVWPTDAADGSVANEARWRKMARLWAPSSVAIGIGGELAPTLAFPNLTIKDGVAWVDGHFCELLAQQVLVATANGLAVVRFDPAANTAELVYRDGVSVPAQSPTGTWELPIAKLVGSALVDMRQRSRPTPSNLQCAVQLVALQTVGVDNAFSVVAWDTVLANVGGAYSAATRAWTAPFAGTVEVSANLVMNLSVAAVTPLIGSVFKNGTTEFRLGGVTASGSVSQTTAAGSVLIPVVAGDTIDARVFVNAPGVTKQVRESSQMTIRYAS